MSDRIPLKTVGVIIYPGSNPSFPNEHVFPKIRIRLMSFGHQKFWIFMAWYNDMLQFICMNTFNIISIMVYLAVIM